VEPPRAKETPPPPKETPPPKPEKAETPPPRARPVDDAPPPREIARPTPPRPTELTLPREVKKETPALDSPAARDRLIEKPVPPPPPAIAARTPEPRVPTPTAAPAPPPAPAVAARPPAPEPVRPGRPDAPPASTGSITLDVSDFPFTYYLRQVQAKISERWAPPRGTLAGGERVVVLFEISRDGQIRDPAVEKSSGHAIYDQSALRAIMDASPFPPLPPEFKAPSLKVHFGFEFRPEG
jgi:TonB family protein